MGSDAPKRSSCPACMGIDRGQEWRPRNDSVIFLDFDGVIRIAREIGVGKLKAEFCKDRMRMLAAILNMTGAYIVVISDWRNAASKEEIEKFLHPYLDMYLHKDWATPITGKRWNEVAAWLKAHPSVVHYAILEDFAPNFEGCPPIMRDRVVLCTSRFGLVPHHMQHLRYLLRHVATPCW